MTVDVAIVGAARRAAPAQRSSKVSAGPKRAGFGAGTLPRDHVGESQLPAVSTILDEMGVWDKVEAAGFPIKIGATYRWGRTDELWDFEFVPLAVQQISSAL